MPMAGIFFLTLVVLLFGFLCLWLAAKLGGTRQKDIVQKENYECGVPIIEVNESKINVKFYLVAILFIIFDIEIIFLFPWAVAFNRFLATGNGIYFLGAMLVFLGIFIFGLIWEIKARALDWDK